MFAVKLSSAFKALISCKKFRDTDHTGDLGGECGRERGMSDDIFERSLRVGGYEAYCRGRGMVEAMRQRNFTWL